MTSTTELGQDILDVDKPDSDDLTLWSVTTIIACLDRPALTWWATEQTANAAIDSANTWQAMLEDQGRDETVKWLRDARFRKPKTLLSGADLGSVVHHLCEQYALTAVMPTPEEIEEHIFSTGGKQVDILAEAQTAQRMLNQFDGWLQRFTPSYQATEVCVYSPDYGYAGQLDAVLTIDGVRFITDYKTSREAYDAKGQPKTPYPEQVALQLAAYRWADFAAVWRPRRFEKFRRRYYLLSAQERELAVATPDVDTGLVIQITPETCEAYPMSCNEEVHRAFLYTLEAFRWLNETSKTVMSEPLQ